MSKQYLTTHTVDDAHPTDIFSIAATPSQLLSASGSSTLRIYSTLSSDFPLQQEIEGAHKLGCHHVVTSSNGKKAASVGFGGEVKTWSTQNDHNGMEAWFEEGSIEDGNKAGEIWAVALSEDGQYLASTTYDGRINIWDLTAERQKVREYETKGSFGMSIDVSPNGELTASGHASGSVYIFSNSTGRLLHSLPGLIKPIRSVRFSPGSSLLGAAGDAKIIALYDTRSGEQIANLAGHGGWVFSLDWSFTGEYLLSGSWDGKIKVWSVETRQCVATHSEAAERAVWAVRWLPKVGQQEGFAVAGSSKSISFYREAAGG